MLQCTSGRETPLVRQCATTVVAPKLLSYTQSKFVYHSCSLSLNHPNILVARITEQTQSIS